MKISDGIIKAAYIRTNEETGLAADRICTSPVVSLQFIEACYHLQGMPSPLTLPHRLMNLRKKGELPHSKKPRKDLFL